MAPRQDVCLPIVVVVVGMLMRVCVIVVDMFAVPMIVVTAVRLLDLQR